MSAALTPQQTKWETSGLLPGPKAVKARLRIGQWATVSMQRGKESTILGSVVRRSFCAGLTTHTGSQGEVRIYIFYCLARSLALNAACHTGTSCW